MIMHEGWMTMHDPCINVMGVFLYPFLLFIDTIPTYLPYMEVWTLLTCDLKLCANVLHNPSILCHVCKLLSLMVLDLISGAKCGCVRTTS